jgi:hypothetical protein
MNVTVIFDLTDPLQSQAFDAAKAIITGDAPATETPAKQTRARKSANAEQDAPKQPEPAKPTHTLEDIRAKVTGAQDEGVTKDDIRGLLKEFGATKVPDLDPAKYDEFATKLQKLVEDAI